MIVLGVIIGIVIFIVGYLRVAQERIRRLERARSLELLADRPSVALDTGEALPEKVARIRAAKVAQAESKLPNPGGVQLDPNWEWELVRETGKPDEWVKVRCRHLEVVPVDSVDGSIPAQLCLTCDTQFNVPIERKGSAAGSDQVQ